MTARAILSLPIADIAIGERVGFYHPDHAARLGASMAAEGQHDPIHVRRNGNRAALPWTLVAGLHRLRGAQIVDIATIDAIQVADSGTGAVALRRLELSENVDHRTLRPIERSIFLDALAKIAEAEQYGERAGESRQARGARARWDADVFPGDATATMAEASNWDVQAAERAGVSLRSLQRYRLIFRRIAEPFPHLAEALNAHALGERLTNMAKIAGIAGEDGRRQVIEIILADPDFASVDAAMVQAGISSSKATRIEAVEENHFYQRFFMNWDRLDLRRKRLAAVALVKSMTPGMKAELRRMLDEEAQG